MSGRVTRFAGLFLPEFLKPSFCPWIWTANITMRAIYLFYILKIYNSLYIIIVIGDTVPWKI